MVRELTAARAAARLALGIFARAREDIRALATFALTLALAGAALIWGAYVLGTAARVFCETSRFCIGGL